MLLKNIFFHPDFKLNDTSFLGISDLLIFAKKQDVYLNDFLIQWFNNELFITVQTSGSTGKPKKIKLAKKAMVYSALATGNYFNLNEKTSAFLCLSTKYIAGKMMLVRAMVLGWHLDILETNTKPLANTKKNYDFGAMVPLQVHHSIADLDHTKQLIIGGGAIDNNLFKKIIGLKTDCYATYGMTETITHIAVKKIALNVDYYTVLPQITIAKDARDCLVIQAPHLTQEPVITNDLVQLKGKNQFKWLGRFDTIINSGGVKIIPEAVEAKLAALISQRFFISSIPDALLENKVILIIEGSPYPLDLKELADYLSQYEIPKNIYFTPKFVVTDTKKIQRQKTLDLIKF